MRRISSLLVFYLILAVTLLSPPAPAVGHPSRAQTLPTQVPTPPKLILDHTLSGWFTIVWGDPQPESGGTPLEIYLLTDADGRQTTLSLAGDVSLPAGGVHALNGQRVTVTGRATRAPNDSLVTTDLEVMSIQIVAEKTRSADARTAILGPQPRLTILCKFPDINTGMELPTYYRGLMSTSFPGLDHYWREQSYNAVTLSGSRVVGWYTLPHPWASYGLDATFPPLDQLTEDCLAAAALDVDIAQFTGFNLMTNAMIGCCAWGGSYVFHDRTLQAAWLPSWSHRYQTVVAHEMGHSFGLPHQLLQNSWDVMSEGYDYCHLATHPVYGCLGQHTVAYHKNWLGWIAPAQKYVATLGSQARIVLQQLALPNGAGLMAQIPIPHSTTRFYTVEARRFASYDVKLPGQAVIIHEIDTARGDWARLIDADGNGNSGDAGAMWTVGETYSDDANGISVSIDAETATGFLVTISARHLPWQRSPEQNTSVLEGAIPFDWESVPEASLYAIQIDTDPLFGSGLAVDDTTPATNYTATLPVGVYYWRVRALPDGMWHAPWELNVGTHLGTWQANEIVYDGSTLCTNRQDVDIAIDETGNAYAIWADCRSVNAANPFNWDLYFAYRPTGGSWSPGERVNPEFANGGQYRPKIAVDRMGIAYAVWVDWQNTPGIYFASRPPGGSWSTGVLVSNPNSGEAPDLAVDLAGNIHVVWQQWHQNAWNVYYARRAVGALWSAPARLDSTGQAHQTNPSIAVDPAGNAYAVWSDDRHPNQRDILFASRPVDGAWSASTRVNDDTLGGYQELAAIAVDGASTAYVVWENRSLGKIYSAHRFTNNVWSPAETVSDAFAYAPPTIAVSGAGNVYVAWSSYVNTLYNELAVDFATRSNSGTWSTTTLAGNAFSSSVAIAAHRSGTVAVIWNDRLKGGSYVKQRSETGQWNARTIIDPVDGGNQAGPAIEVDAAGNAYAVWQDSRHGSWDIYYAFRPTGDSWGDNLPVSDGPGFTDQVNPALAMDAAGTLYAVWEDNRNGNWDIRFAYRPAGGSWSNSVRLNDDDGVANQRNPVIATNSAGYVIILWQDKREGSWDIYSVLRSSSGFWSPNLRVDDDPGHSDQIEPSVALDAAGSAYAVWEDNRSSLSVIRFALRLIGGIWISHAQVTSGSIAYRSPAIAVNPIGEAFAVFEGRDSGQDHVYGIFRSTQTGWQSQTVLGESTAGYRMASHDAAVDDLGAIHAIWQERSGQIFAAYRLPGGGWGPGIAVQTENGFYGSGHPSVDADSAGNAYAVWEDPRDTGYIGGGHIYFSRALKGVFLPTPTPTVGFSTPTPTPAPTSTPSPAGPRRYMPLLLHS